MTDNILDSFSAFSCVKFNFVHLSLSGTSMGVLHATQSMKPQTGLEKINKTTNDPPRHNTPELEEHLVYAH